MAFPSVKLTTLASLAHRLPAACWLAQPLEQTPERWSTLPVWWVEGDLDMAALDLVTTLSSDGQWLPPPAFHRTGWQFAPPRRGLAVGGRPFAPARGADGRLAHPCQRG